MSLAKLVAAEAGVAIERVMLLRHSNAIIAKLRASGGSVEEYTSIQRTESEYDYSYPESNAVEVVVVIVDDTVYGVYRVAGVEQVGTTYSVASSAHKQFNEKRKRPDRPAKRFRMISIPSSCIKCRVRGWERRERTPVQRSNGGFFHDITVDVPASLRTEQALREELEKGVRSSLKDSAVKRQQRLETARRFPAIVEIRALAFIRNPDVVAEVLCRAAGVCEACHSPAPFIRRSGGTPYLEVHHKKTPVRRGRRQRDQRNCPMPQLPS